MLRRTLLLSAAALALGGPAWADWDDLDDYTWTEDATSGLWYSGEITNQQYRDWISSNEDYLHDTYPNINCNCAILATTENYSDVVESVDGNGDCTYSVNTGTEDDPVEAMTHAAAIMFANDVSQAIFGNAGYTGTFPTFEEVIPPGGFYDCNTYTFTRLTGTSLRMFVITSDEWDDIEPSQTLDEEWAEDWSATYGDVKPGTGSATWYIGVPDRGFRIVTYADLGDDDADGVRNYLDNCTDVANAGSAGCDTDSDGYGNRCDGDFDQTYTTTSGDYTGYWLPAYTSGTNPHGEDMDCSGSTTAGDYTTWWQPLYTSGTLGPSGLECAGTSPCP